MLELENLKKYRTRHSFWDRPKRKVRHPFGKITITVLVFMKGVCSLCISSACTLVPPMLEDTISHTIWLFCSLNCHKNGVPYLTAKETIIFCSKLCEKYKYEAQITHLNSVGVCKLGWNYENGDGDI